MEVGGGGGGGLQRRDISGPCWLFLSVFLLRGLFLLTYNVTNLILKYMYA